MDYILSSEDLGRPTEDLIQTKLIIKETPDVGLITNEVSYSLYFKKAINFFFFFLVNLLEAQSNMPIDRKVLGQKVISRERRNPDPFVRKSTNPHLKDNEYFNPFHPGN